MAKKTVSSTTQTPAPVRPPAIVANPPRPNRALLIVSAVLWFVWLGFLFWLALQGN